MTRELTFIDADRGDPWGAAPLAIREVGIAEARAGGGHYPDPRGTPAVRSAIAAALEAEGGGPYDPGDEVLVTAGASPALFAALLALTQPGDPVLVPDPGWPTYREMLAALGRRAVPYPVEEPAPALARAAPLMIVTSPHNPTGRVFDEAYWRALSDLGASRPDLTILADEAHRGIVYDGRVAPSPVALPSLRPRAVVVRSFSKSHSLAGWRVGYLAGPRRLVARIRDVAVAQGGGASVVSQAAALAALARGATGVGSLLEHYQSNRDLLVGQLAQLPGVTCPAPEGTFYAFPRLEGLSSDHVARALEGRWRLRVAPGSRFGARGEHHLRISFALDDETVREVAARLARCLAELRSREEA